MYIIAARPQFFMLEAHRMPWALALALPKAGRSIAARIAMMAMTTRSSISVNAGWARARDLFCGDLVGWAVIITIFGLTQARYAWAPIGVNRPFSERFSVNRRGDCAK